MLDYSVLDSGVPRLVFDSASCLVVGLFLSPHATPRYQLFLSPPATPHYPLFLSLFATPHYPLFLSPPATPHYPLFMSPPATPLYPLFLSPPATPKYPLFLSPSPVVFCTTIRSSISAHCHSHNYSSHIPPTAPGSHRDIACSNAIWTMHVHQNAQSSKTTFF